MMAQTKNAPSMGAEREDILDELSDEKLKKIPSTLLEKQLDLDAGERLSKTEVLQASKKFKEEHGVRLLDRHDDALMAGIEAEGEDEYLLSEGWLKRAATIEPMLSLGDENFAAREAAVRHGVDRKEKYNALQENNATKANEIQLGAYNNLLRAQSRIQAEELETLGLRYSAMIEDGEALTPENIAFIDNRAAERLAIAFPEATDDQRRKLLLDQKMEAQFGIGSKNCEEAKQLLDATYQQRASLVASAWSIAGELKRRQYRQNFEQHEKTVKEKQVEAQRLREQLNTIKSAPETLATTSQETQEPTETFDDAIRRGQATEQQAQQVAEQRQKEAQEKVKKLLKEKERAQKKAERFQGVMGLFRSWVNAEEARAARSELSSIQEELTQAEQELNAFGGKTRDARVERRKDQMQEQIAELDHLTDGIEQQQEIIHAANDKNDIFPPSKGREYLRKAGELNQAYLQRVMQYTELNIESATPTELAQAIIMLDYEKAKLEGEYDGFTEISKMAIHQRLEQYRAAYEVRTQEQETMARQIDIALTASNLNDLRETTYAFGSGKPEDFLFAPLSDAENIMKRDEHYVAMRNISESHPSMRAWQQQKTQLQEIIQTSPIHRLAAQIQNSMNSVDKIRNDLAILAEQAAIQDIKPGDTLDQKYQQTIKDAAKASSELRELQGRYESAFTSLSRAKLSYDAAYSAIVPADIEGYFPVFEPWTQEVLGA